MKRLFSSGAKPLVVGVIVALVVGTTGAVAASLITGQDVKNGSLAAKDLNKKLRKKINKSGTAGTAGAPGTAGATGPAGPQGPQGQQGPQGVAGADGENGDDGAPGDDGDDGDDGATGATGPQGPATPATYVGANWGQIDRNTEGSPVSELRAGPIFGATAAQQPPLGDGSLGLVVKDGTEKVAFGNQVDFAGDPVSGLDQIAYSYTQTGEDFDRSPGNLPNIQFEINPNTGAIHYSSMVFVPPAVGSKVAEQWITTDADATPPAGSGWYFTNGTLAASTGCGQAGGQHFCSLDEAQTELGLDQTGPTPAFILTAAVSKGKDQQYQGAVDALQINTEMFDFEPFGVQTTTP